MILPLGMDTGQINRVLWVASGEVWLAAGLNLLIHRVINLLVPKVWRWASLSTPLPDRKKERQSVHYPYMASNSDVDNKQNKHSRAGDSRPCLVSTRLQSVIAFSPANFDADTGRHQSPAPAIDLNLIKSQL